MTPTLEEEKKLREDGFSAICGLDEVGRGSWAGPLVVGAVILPEDFVIPPGFGDSKQVKPQARKRFSEYIKNRANSWAISEVPPSLINKVGIGKATHIAFRKALKILPEKPDFILVDAFYIKRVNRKNQKAIVCGDQKCASIAAASIIAKVYRDQLMKRLARKYPEYGFGRHKGYGTKNHQEAIKEFGFSRIHRRSFNLAYLT